MGCSFTSLPNLTESIKMKTFKVYFRGTGNFELIQAYSHNQAKRIFAISKGLLSLAYLRSEIA